MKYNEKIQMPSNYYFQIAESLVKLSGHRFFVLKNIIEIPTSRICYQSEIIWVENDTNVTYAKNRFIDIHETNHLHSEEEIKQFRWVKLSARDARESRYFNRI